MKMKKFLWSAMAILMVSALNVGFTSCGDDDDPDEVSVSTPMVSIGNSGGSQTIQIMSNTGWTISGAQPWLMVSPMQGSHNGAITITANENTDENSRTCTLFVQAGSASATIQVTQSPNTPHSLADTVKGTYAGRLMNGTEIVQDAYIVTINKLHIALVTSPIKKTNVILKNVNFQYAVRLWNYLQEHFSDETNKEDKENKDYYDSGKLKQYYDEGFLLDYLVLNTLDESGFKDLSVNKEEIKERLVGNIVEKIIDIDNQISEEQLSEIVAKQFVVIKNKYVASDNKIKEIFHNAINKYMDKVKDLKIDDKLEANNEEFNEKDRGE